MSRSTYMNERQEIQICLRARIALLALYVELWTEYTFLPKYSTVEARMRTFRDWPPALRQQPSELTDAGFYYIGEWVGEIFKEF